MKKQIYFHAFFVVESGGHCPFCSFENLNKIHLRNDIKLIKEFRLKCDNFAAYFIKLWNIKTFSKSAYVSMIDGPSVFDSKTYVNVQYPFNINDEDRVIANKWDMETYYLVLFKMWEYLKPYGFSPIEARIIIEHLP